jgi:uncharacterized protein (DUF4415 family)
MPAKSGTTRKRWRDPDDPPRLTRAWFEGADLYDGARLVRRGRPKAAVTKVQTTLRLDAEVLEHFKSGGPGWQTRINETLRRAAHRSARRAAPSSRSRRASSR